MKTHTLKRIGKHDKYWLTFTPDFLSKIHKCHPHTQSMFLSLLVKAIKEVGKTVEVVEHQFPDLIEQVNRISPTYEEHVALDAVLSGFRMMSRTTERNLEVLDWIVRTLLVGHKQPHTKTGE